RVESSDGIRIADSPPSAPEVRLEPARPSKAAPTRMVIAKPPIDPDGDAVTYKVEWLLDGAATGVPGEEFPAAKHEKKKLLTARVIASDGEMAGPAALAEAMVANTPPEAPKVELSPREPKRTDAIGVRIAREAGDP